MGERSGLDYSAVVSVAQIFDAEFDREMLEKVRLLEAGALSAMRGKDLTDLLNG